MEWPDFVNEIVKQESESIHSYLNGKPLSKMGSIEKFKLKQKLGSEKFKELVKKQSKRE